MAWSCDLLMRQLLISETQILESIIKFQSQVGIYRWIKNNSSQSKIDQTLAACIQSKW